MAKYPATAKPPAPRQPSEREKRTIQRARERQKKRPVALAFTMEIGEDGTTPVLGAPHADEVGYRLHRLETFGTTSDAFSAHAIGWLGAAMHQRGASHPTQDALNAALAAFNAFAPRDEVEALLALQAVATHEAAMSMLMRAKAADDLTVMERCGALATKLQRTFVAQIEALAKLRRGGEQTVRVEHVHVYHGGQAVVGAVTTPGGGGSLENGHQAYGPVDQRALAVAPGAPLLRQDPARDGVSVARDEGQEAMPHSRRGSGKRRTAR
ncbi:hypothetical protein [Methylobacterium nodulans]|uniref:Uncharacterized protein n=1 Tax=Methylobacterium nodulans (strain LMG 21967 / CNCM I-2342 / ORS 2060) TaxID=460265 RepID=B8IC43_METNO|nr:hypothetical protein [Methylobacterium nodulans]ACL61225.1 conserved hypothetical protein [Methylobacterium nodulans ORS 2060]